MAEVDDVTLLSLLIGYSPSVLQLTRLSPTVSGIAR